MDKAKLQFFQLTAQIELGEQSHIDTDMGLRTAKNPFVFKFDNVDTHEPGRSSKTCYISV